MFSVLTIIISSIVILGYLPVLTTQFGINNDYNLLPGTLLDKIPFDEFPHLYMIGREAMAFLLTWQSWFINEMWHFTAARWFGVGFLLLFLFALHAFLNKVGFRGKAIWPILICIAFLPESHALIIYLLLLMSGFPVLLIAMGAYYLLELGTSRNRQIKVRIGQLGLSAILFLAALFTYQSNALFVFVCTFTYLLKDFLDEKDMDWRRVGRDILFFLFCVGIYYLLHTKLFLKMIPVDANPTNWSPTGGRYEFAVNFNILYKIGLLYEIEKISLGGMLHMVLSDYAAYIGLFILFLGHILFWHYSTKHREVAFPIALRHQFVFIGVLIILFMLVNLPGLLAKNCYHVFGYRMVFPAAVMIFLWQALLWYKLYEWLSGLYLRQILNTAVIIFLAFNFIIPFTTLLIAAHGFTREVSFIRQQLDKINWHEKNSILFIAPEEEDINFSNRHLMYEYRLPARYGNLISYLCRKKNYPLKRTMRVAEPIVYTDAYTEVLDIKKAANPDAEPGVIQAKILNSTGYPGSLFISLTSRGNFSLAQITDNQISNFFWHIDFSRSKVIWVEFDLENVPRVLKNFSFGAIEKETHLYADMEYELITSNDGKSWKKQILKEACHPLYKNRGIACRLTDNKTYQKYRFYMSPIGGQNVFDIETLKAEFTWAN